MNYYNETIFSMAEPDLYGAIFDDKIDIVRKKFEKNDEYDMIQRNYNILKLAFNRSSYEIINFLITKMDSFYNDSISRDIVFARLCQGCFHDYKKLYFILQHIKNINIQDKQFDDNTILYRAMVALRASAEKYTNGYIDVIKLLVESGADPYIENKYGDSTIDLIVNTCKQKIELFEILLNNMTKKYIKVETLNQIIFSNCINKYDLIEMLLPYVIDINAPLQYTNITILKNIKISNPEETDIIELLEANGAL